MPALESSWLSPLTSISLRGEEKSSRSLPVSSEIYCAKESRSIYFSKHLTLWLSEVPATCLNTICFDDLGIVVLRTSLELMWLLLVVSSEHMYRFAGILLSVRQTQVHEVLSRPTETFSFTQHYN